MPVKNALKVVLIQLNSSEDIEANLKVIRAELAKICDVGLDLVVLPECVLAWGRSQDVFAASKTEASWCELLSPLSLEYGVAILWGGLPLDEGNSTFNSALTFDSSGSLIGRYDKVHLFQRFMGDKTMDETQVYDFGSGESCVLELEGWRLGVGICYDLRFPELYRAYAGCDALICTAAFTKATGRDHWELLLRSRAVENQAYMLGVGQCGKNDRNGQEAFGHSMVVDDWGRVVASLGDEPACLVVELERSSMLKKRENFPALKNRRL